MQKSARAQAEWLGRSWLQTLVFNINFISKFSCALVLQKSRKRRSLKNWLEFGSAQLSEPICLPARALGVNISPTCHMAWALSSTVGSTGVSTKSNFLNIIFKKSGIIFSTWDSRSHSVFQGEAAVFQQVQSLKLPLQTEIYLPFLELKPRERQ